MEKSIVVAIGRNVGENPMPDSDWYSFQGDLLSILYSNIVTIHASLNGQASSDGWSDEGSVWVAGSCDSGIIGTLRRDLAKLARLYRQDAIALTVGDTELITPQRTYGLITPEHTDGLYADEYATDDEWETP